MPQGVALMMVAVGVYAGLRIASEHIAKAAAEADAARDELRRQEARARGNEPKDLGALELDEATGQYRPTRH